LYTATAIAAAAVGATVAAATFAIADSGSPSGPAAPTQTLNHWVYVAPDDAFVAADQATPGPIACQRPAPDNRKSLVLHCMTPAQMRAAYGITDTYQGDGQTIVLVDSFGSPTAAEDLNFFAETFGMPTPHFDQVFVGGQPGYLKGQGSGTGNGSGQNGPSSAEGWATEANLDVQWAYAMAPKAHIVLLATNTAETQGVPGLPEAMKAIDSAIDTYPAGTVFSMSFGTDESAFAGAAAQQFAKFDQTFQKGLAKGDTFLSSAGDNGSVGVIRAHRASATSDVPQVSYPNVSPFVTSVGGTQRQYGWTWHPTGPDIPIAANGSRTPAWWAWDVGGNSEAVGNEPGFALVTGGGTSSVYARPSYQDGVASVVGNHRGVPDLAWNMAINGGALVYRSFFPAIDGAPSWFLVGGTSASSPQVAGVVALANQARAAAGKAPIGNLNQAIYSSGFNKAAAFNDIVPQVYGDGSVPSAHLKSNQVWDITPGAALALDSVPGHPTTGGYDLTTGWGSPNGMGFVNALAALP
jgi:subtilase family serine protease